MARGLTKESVVAGALTVLDSDGLEGLTVRAVAAVLGVQAPALYWHVRDKQALLDEMATELWRRIGTGLSELPPEFTWQQSMTAFANIMRTTVLSVRDGARVFSGTYLTDTAVLKNQEEGLAGMIGDGFTLAGAINAYALIYNFTVGFCIEEQSVAQAVREGDARFSLSAREERLDDGAHPLVVAAGPQIFGDQDARFDLLVAVLVDAAGRMRQVSA
jgi:TetR/AcrR family transcriptional regulator, tetracycline repressor protein